MTTTPFSNWLPESPPLAQAARSRCGRSRSGNGTPRQYRAFRTGVFAPRRWRPGASGPRIRRPGGAFVYQARELSGFSLAAVPVQPGEPLLWTAYLNGGSVPRGADFVRAVRELAERAGVDPSPLERPQPRNRRADLLHDFFGFCRFELVGEGGTEARRYLDRRGFPDQAIADYIRANFEVLQLNLLGARKVIDFDGRELTEKELAERYAIRFTPTFQFFPPPVDGVAAKEPLAREVARAPGYLKPPHFLAMFRFVRDKAYERGSFRDYLTSSKG